MDVQGPPSLGLDAETLAFVKAVHQLKATGAPLNGYEKLRDELFAQRHRISVYVLTLAEVIEATTGHELPRDAAWQEFRLIVDAEHALESNPAGGSKRKRSRDEQARMRGFVKLAAFWSLELVQYYRLDLASQRQMRLLCKCASHYLDFVGDFVPTANAVLLARQRQALYKNRTAPIGQSGTTTQEARWGMYCPLLVSDLQYLVDVVEKNVVQVYGQTLQLSDGIPNDQALWTASIDGDIIVHNGQTLRSLRPHHFEQYLLQEDDYGMLIPRGASVTSSNCKAARYLGHRRNPSSSTEPGALSQPPSEVHSPPLPHGALETSSEVVSRRTTPSSCNWDTPVTFSPTSTVTLRLPSVLNTHPLEGNTTPAQEGYVTPHAWLSAPPETPPSRCNPNEPCIISNSTEDARMESPDGAGVASQTDVVADVLPSPPNIRSGSWEHFDIRGTVDEAWDFNLTPDCLNTTGISVTANVDGEAVNSGSLQLPLTASILADSACDHIAGAKGAEAPVGGLEPLCQSQSEFMSAWPCSVCKGGCKLCRVPLDDVQAEANRLYSVARNSHDLIKDAVQFKASWMAPIEFASVRPSILVESTAGSADVFLLSSAAFEERAQRNERFDRPVIIKESFPDGCTYSPRWYAHMLESAYAKLEIPVLKGPATQSISMRVDEIVHALLSVKATGNAPEVQTVELEDLPSAIKPALTRLPRFTPFLRCARRSSVRERGFHRPPLRHGGYDFSTSLSHNILSFPGAYRGARWNPASGIWMRNLFGRQLFWFVPHHEMTPQDWDDYASQHSAWDPKGRGKAIVIEQNDVLFLPHEQPVLYAQLALETTLMDGGVIWDEHSIDSLLNCLNWTASSHVHAPELLLHNIAAVIEQLPEVLKLHECGDQAERVKALVTRVRYQICPCDAAVSHLIDQCHLHGINRMNPEYHFRDSGVALSNFMSDVQVEVTDRRIARDERASESSSEWSSESSESDDGK